MSHALTTGGGNGLGISSGNLIRWIKVMRTRRLAEQGRFMLRLSRVFDDSAVDGVRTKLRRDFESSVLEI
jgi:hypothetical protein